MCTIRAVGSVLVNINIFQEVPLGPKKNWFVVCCFLVSVWWDSFSARIQLMLT